jgi:hypothetical protein
MSNEWALGIASGALFDPSQCVRLETAVADGRRDSAVELLASAVPFVESANSSYFRFRVDGIIDPLEPTLVVTSASTTTGRLGLGLAHQKSTRKLVVLVITDDAATGATLQIHGRDSEPVPAAQGRIIMFPAYCDAAVELCRAGELRGVAFHAFGNAFE